MIDHLAKRVRSRRLSTFLEPPRGIRSVHFCSRGPCSVAPVHGRQCGLPAFPSSAASSSAASPRLCSQASRTWPDSTGREQMANRSTNWPLRRQGTKWIFLALFILSRSASFSPSEPCSNGEGGAQIRGGGTPSPAGQAAWAGQPRVTAPRLSWAKVKTQLRSPDVAPKDGSLPLKSISSCSTRKGDSQDPGLFRATMTISRYVTCKLMRSNSTTGGPDGTSDRVSRKPRRKY